MVDGISNFRIEKAFKNTNDEDIDNNFVGGFRSEKRKVSICYCKN